MPMYVVLDDRRSPRELGVIVALDYEQRQAKRLVFGGSNE